MSYILLKSSSPFGLDAADGADEPIAGREVIVLGAIHPDAVVVVVLNALLEEGIDVALARSWKRKHQN